ncbi:MAG: hypothetical protein ACLP1Q_17645 [Solirubrobacteraceae bacterium]
MSVNSYTDLAAHAGHRVAVVIYAQENAAVECETCSVVLVDFARADETELAELLALAEQCGIAEDTLDETVHDMAAATGSSVNNEGRDRQIAYLQAEIGTRATRELLDRERQR